MCQNRALRLLEKKEEWLSVKEIAKRMGIGRTATTTNLKKLYEQGYIIRKTEKVPWITYYYKIAGTSL